MFEYTDKLSPEQEVEDLTEQLISMQARYDKVIKEMRAEVDAANALWDTHLKQWEANDWWMTTYRKIVILSTYAVLILAFVLAVSN